MVRIGVYETVGPWYSWWPAWGKAEERGSVVAGAGDERGVGGWRRTREKLMWDDMWIWWVEFGMERLLKKRVAMLTKMLALLVCYFSFDAKLNFLL